MSIGVPKSANALINTKSEAANIVGIMSGTTTLKKLFIPVHPRFLPASSNELSIFLSAPLT